MTIENELQSRKIEINVSDCETEYYPSYRLEIDIQTEEITAHFNREIWITLVDLETFTAKLNELDKTRNGDVKLNSMSPDEFHLRFRNIDKLGHLSVEIKVEKDSPYQNNYSDVLKVEFEIDPTNFKNIINELSTLKNVC